MHRVVFSFLAVLLAASAFAVDLTDAQRAAIEARIKPVGESCMEGDNTCGAPVVAASTGPRSGEEVYNTACMACHSTGAAGAPKVGDAAAWAARIAKGTDALYASGVNGVPGTGMMAKGGCVACSDEEIHAAVDFMVANSQ
jgi:cytochrome c5